jgi:NAD+ kinase
LLIALGGDGTMLKAGELGATNGIPVLGINLGRVGFLIEVARDNWRPALDRVLAGDYWLERRMRLTVDLERQGRRLEAGSALNEVVVGRGRTARPIRLQAEVDNRYLATYVADALICSSATGSTAYALAAGGPILPPEMRNLLLVPVAPHLSVDRAIVLAEGSAVRLELLSEEEADLSCDGQVRQALVVHDVIHIASSPQDALFVRLQDPSYFFHNLKTFMNQVHTQGGE